MVILLISILLRRSRAVSSGLGGPEDSGFGEVGASSVTALSDGVFRLYVKLIGVAVSGLLHPASTPIVDKRATRLVGKRFFEWGVGSVCFTL